MIDLRNKLFALLLTLLLSACAAGSAGSRTSGQMSLTQDITDSQTSPLLTQIAFGSCAVQWLPQTFWRQISSDEPELFIFGGDNIYADIELIDGQPKRKVATPELLSGHYALLGNNPDFIQFQKKTPILPVWDDHDYGLSDGGSSYLHKNNSEAQFLDFWKVPPQDPRRSYPGTYFATRYGSAGNTVQVILLDTRYFRSDLKVKTNPGYMPGNGKYQPDPDPTKTLLGAQQWQWLTEELQKPADLRLLVSSIQVIAEGHGWERWGNLPAERDKLYKLIADNKVNGVVFLSGDRHKAGFYELHQPPLEYPLFELTSSSLNKPYPDNGEMGPYQIGAMYGEANYALIHIDWTARNIELSIKSMDGTPIMKRLINIDSLKAKPL